MELSYHCGECNRNDNRKVTHRDHRKITHPWSLFFTDPGAGSEPVARRSATLKWAFSEASVLFIKGNEPAKKYLDRLAQKHGKGKALSILAHKLGRAAYYMLKNKVAFDQDKFLSH